MTLDLLDRAFIQRLRSERIQPAAVVDAPLPEHPPVAGELPKGAAPAAPSPVRSTPIAAAPASNDVGEVVGATDAVERLLAVAAAEWKAVCDEVERAAVGRGDGREGFVLAVVARRRGDGCTTFIKGLARSLRDRGIEAVETTADRVDREATGIQLVDAGSWFGTGPIRRDRATALAEICDAAILLRRADRSTAAAFGRALEVAGVRVLGEVTTFGRATTESID